MKLSVNNFGEVAYWDLSNPSNVIQTYLLPSMTGVTQYTKSTSTIPMRTLSSQGNVENNRYLDWSWNINSTPVYIMQNGMIFTYSNSNDGYLSLVVDINGFKKPNIMGIDGFAFWIDPETSTVVPAGAKFTRVQILSGSSTRICKRDSSWQYYRGGYCAALMQKDGWSITSDYPWGNGGLTQK